MPARAPAKTLSTVPPARLRSPGPSVAYQSSKPAVKASQQAPVERTPFDIVYMWVNGSDPEYSKARAQLGGRKGTGDRDRDNGELRFSLRSLDKNMPWFTGTIHFVHQNLPCWLNVDHPRLNLVHHRDIFTAQSETLPTMSSDAIEAHLHRIPGLQRYFALVNDDFFFGRPTSMNDFMLSNGDLVLWFEKYTVKGTKQDHLKLMKQGKKSWLSKIYHTKSLLVDKFGVTDSNKYHFLKHSPTMLDRDRMAKLWETFPDAIGKTIRYRHRKPDGLSMTWLHHHYCLLDPDSSCYVPAQAYDGCRCSAPVILTPSCRYMDREATFLKVGSSATEKVRTTLQKWAKAPPTFFTINDEKDVGRGKFEEGRRYAYEYFLPTMFPQRSQWETASTCVPVPKLDPSLE